MKIDYNMLITDSVETHKQMTRTARRSGVVRKEWVFVGWYEIPNLDNALTIVHRGEWLVVEFETNVGVIKERYRVGTKEEVMEKMAAAQQTKESEPGDVEIVEAHEAFAEFASEVDFETVSDVHSDIIVGDRYSILETARFLFGIQYEAPRESVAKLADSLRCKFVHIIHYDWGRSYEFVSNDGHRMVGTYSEFSRTRSLDLYNR